MILTLNRSILVYQLDRKSEELRKKQDNKKAEEARKFADGFRLLYSDYVHLESDDDTDKYLIELLDVRFSSRYAF